MSVRLGTLVEGTRYEVLFDATRGSKDVSFVLVGWLPAHAAEPRAWTMRIEPGGSALHAMNAPLAADYHALRLEVDVPDGQEGGTLTVSGLVAGRKAVHVGSDQTYLVQVVKGGR